MIGKRISIVGSVGVPASYGGFETLAENLVRYHASQKIRGRLSVYCSSQSRECLPSTFLTAELRYVPVSANGVASVVYDIWSLVSAVVRGDDTVLVLGVSGAVALPFLRSFSSLRIVTNIDGIEWQREKWHGLARWFLRLSERLAVRFSHEVITDNAGIADYVARTYSVNSHIIAYGGDHAIRAKPKPYEGDDLPVRYALALCRIEPENNVEMILEAFSRQDALPLVFVGNWKGSTYGEELRSRYGRVTDMYLVDPIYDQGILREVRGNAAVYVHGHSAGGTNPSLVEMMHFGLPVLAYDCVFNRYTTDGQAVYFTDAEHLASRVAALDPAIVARVGAAMARLAGERYTWDAVGREYFLVLTCEA